jgi:hypothetical protein
LTKYQNKSDSRGNWVACIIRGGLGRWIWGQELNIMNQEKLFSKQFFSAVTEGMVVHV